MLEHVDHRALQQKILVFELRLKLRLLWIELIQLVEHQLIGSILVLVNLQTLLDYYLHERYSANILRCLCRSTNTIMYQNPIIWNQDFNSNFVDLDYNIYDLPSGETAIQDGVWFSFTANTLTSFALWDRSEGGRVSSLQFALTLAKDDLPLDANKWPLV